MLPKGNLELRHYQAGDFESLAPFMRDTDKRVFIPGAEKLFRYLDDSHSGDTVTFVLDGEVAAIGMVTQIWEGVGHAYLITTAKIEGHGKQFCDLSAEALDRWHKDFQFRRIQCDCLVDFEKSLRYLERIGFVNEGRMCQYFPNGDDAVRLARFR